MRQPSHPQHVRQVGRVNDVVLDPPITPVQSLGIRQMHRRAQVLEQIHHPIPAVRRLDHHRRRIARLGNHRRELERIVPNTRHREAFPGRTQPPDHRPSVGRRNGTWQRLPRTRGRR